jgi:1-phosphofructokinase family hexose kinase
MILTVTPNPTIDRAVFVRNFRLGRIARAEREVVGPSGKGVDASMVIQELGGETMAFGFSAGFTGAHLSALLDERGLPHNFVTVEGYTREALVLIDVAARRQSTITAPTLIARESHLSQLIDLMAPYADRAWGAILAGSLPAGVPADTYAGWLDRAHAWGLVTLLDTSGEALRKGIRARPHYLKANLRELQPLFKHDLEGLATGAVGAALSMPGSEQPSLAEVKDLGEGLAQKLGLWAREAIMVTLGARGAVVVTTGGHYHAQPPSVSVANTAGAGDALGGALMLARSRGEDWPAALRLAVAAGASVVTGPATGICCRDQVEALAPRARIERIDRR